MPRKSRVLKKLFLSAGFALLTLALAVWVLALVALTSDALLGGWFWTIPDMGLWGIFAASVPCVLAGTFSILVGNDLG